jgi:hypothetical protein
MAERLKAGKTKEKGRGLELAGNITAVAAAIFFAAGLPVLALPLGVKSPILHREAEKRKGKVPTKIEGSSRRNIK